jgi:hypothetical protein
MFMPSLFSIGSEVIMGGYTLTNMIPKVYFLYGTARTFRAYGGQ